jgi:hypothetical protein
MTCWGRDMILSLAYDETVVLCFLEVFCVDKIYLLSSY